jgi:hypothetical protein
MIPKITMSADESRTSKDSLFPLIANAKLKNNSISYTNNTKNSRKSKKHFPAWAGEIASRWMH